jgi:integrase
VNIISAEKLRDLTIESKSNGSAVLTALKERSAEYAKDSFGPGTQRAYASAWRRYDAWCAEHDLDPFGGAAGPLPLYVTHLAEKGRTVATIRVALAAIATAYRLAGHGLDLRDPHLAPVVEGITRDKGVKPTRQAIPVGPELLSKMVEPKTDEIFRAALCARDRAMLLVGFGGALRRSELVGLTLGDVELVEGRGVIVMISRSKTDQHGAGQNVAIYANPDVPNLCPARALEAWLSFRRKAEDMETSEPEKRPLWCAVSKGGVITGQALSDKAVVRLVKAAAVAAGHDPKGFSGHSLRAGLITSAVEAGAELPGVMRQARHVAPATTMRYYRPADLWKNNVTERIFTRQK